MLPGQGEMEQLWFAVLALGGIFAAFLLFSVLRSVVYMMKTLGRRKARKKQEDQQKILLQAVGKLSEGATHKTENINLVSKKPHVARVHIFIDFSNFDKNWIENAYGLLGEGNQKVRLDWNKVTDIVMREVSKAMSGWQPDLLYGGTYVQASVLPERFTTPRSYKLPKALAANYYIYAKDADLVRSRIDGKEYIAKKLHPTHVFLKFMMRKLPGYHVNISRRVIERNQDGSPVVMTSKSGMQYIKSGEKAVDSKVIADMTAGAMNGAYDVAVLLGSDTDFLPVIETIQKGYGKPVIHVGFERGGHQVRAGCWSHVVLDRRLVKELREPPKVIPRPVEKAGAKTAALHEENAVGAVAARLATPEKQEPVKQVVHLFTPEGLKERQTQPVGAQAVFPVNAAKPESAAVAQQAQAVGAEKPQAAFPENTAPVLQASEAVPVKVDAT